MYTSGAVRISCAKEEVYATLADLYLLEHAVKVQRSAIVAVIPGLKPTQLRWCVQLIAYEKVVSSNVLVVKLRAYLVVLHGATPLSIHVDVRASSICFFLCPSFAVCAVSCILRFRALSEGVKVTRVDVVCHGATSFMW